MSPSAPDHDDYFLDPRLVRRAFDRASATFDAHAAVHGELRTRLLERLDVVRIKPDIVIDLGAGTGHASRALQDRYRQAQVVAVDLSIGMLEQARRQQRFLKRFGRVAADAQALGLKTASADLIFSNLMLQWCSEPDRAFQELARVLKPGGLLMFTSLGPDSLRELRSAWAASDADVHVHRFIDMHDLGDALMRAGFAEPVMDTERLTVTYPSADALLRELKGSGSTNVALGRSRSLKSRVAGRATRTSLEALRAEAVVPLTLEVVYGHAWSPIRPATKRTDPGLFSIPVDQIGRR
jgi:malonyl-CoA O-methyltransferase